VRTDGNLVFRSIAEIVSGSRMYYNISFDSSGARHLDSQYSAWTGTLPDGTVSRLTCSDWTASDFGTRGEVGAVTNGVRYWTSGGEDHCNDNTHLLCFGTAYHPLVAAPTVGLQRVAFVSSIKFAPSTGIATADAVCQTEASGAGLVGTFKALLATTGASAASRFPLGLARWVRPDGVRLVDAAGDLVSKDYFLAPPEVTAIGNHIAPGLPDGPDFSAWTGAVSPGVVSMKNESCADWTSGSGLGNLGYVGLPAVGGTAASDYGYFISGLQRFSCGDAHHVYCFQQ
jgi:hypothetical protein